MKSWKKSLFGIGTGADLGPGDGAGPEGAGLRAGRLKPGLLRQAGGIIERWGWSEK